MRKRKWMWCGIAVFLLTGALSALGVVVKHEPAFYLQSQIPPSDERTQLSNTFLRNFGQMMANRSQEEWGCDVSEAELNSFFEEVFDQISETEGLRQVGISAPSVVLEKDHVRLAFRYGRGVFSTVISYEMKVWLVPKEANVIAVQFLNARAGAMPISSRTILRQLSDFAQKQNYKVSLYRHEGKAVAVVDLQGDNQAKALLTKLQVEDRKLSIRGKSLDNLPPIFEPFPEPRAK